MRRLLRRIKRMPTNQYISIFVNRPVGAVPGGGGDPGGGGGEPLAANPASGIEIGVNVSPFYSFQPSHKMRKDIFHICQDSWIKLSNIEVSQYQFSNDIASATITSYDDNGYPLVWDVAVSAGVVLLDGNDGTAPTGTYIVEFSSVNSSPNDIQILEPADAAGFKSLTSLGTLPNGNTRVSFQYNGDTLYIYIGSNSIVDKIKLYRNEFVNDDLDANPWQQEFLDDLSGFSYIRYLDWMHTNNSLETTLADLNPSGYFSHSNTKKSLPIEWMVDLANRTSTDMWLPIPHSAEQDLVEYWVEYVRDNLNSGLKLYLEWSNETWNVLFDQAFYIIDAAHPVTGNPDIINLTDEGQYTQRWYYHGQKSAELFEWAYDVYTAGGRSTDEIVRVVAGQSVNTFPLEYSLRGANYFGASAFGGTGGGDITSLEDVSAVVDLAAIGGYIYYAVDTDVTLPVIFSGDWNPATETSMPDANVSGVFYNVVGDGTIDDSNGDASSFTAGNIIVSRQAAEGGGIDSSHTLYTTADWAEPSGWYQVSGSIPNTLEGDNAAVSAVLNIMNIDVSGTIDDFDTTNNLTSPLGIPVAIYEGGSHLTPSRADDPGFAGSPSVDDELRVLQLASSAVEMGTAYRTLISGLSAINDEIKFSHFGMHTRTTNVGQFGFSEDFGLNSGKLDALHYFIEQSGKE